MGLGWFFQISQSLAELDQSHCFNQIRLGCDHPGAIHFLDLVSMWPSGETGIFGSALVSTPGEPWPPDTSTTKKLWNVLTSISSTAVFGKTWGEVTEGLLEQDARPLPWSSFLQTAVRRCTHMILQGPLMSPRLCKVSPLDTSSRFGSRHSSITSYRELENLRRVRSFLFPLLFASSVEKPDFYFVSFISESLRLCVCLWL